MNRGSLNVYDPMEDCYCPECVGVKEPGMWQKIKNWFLTSNRFRYKGPPLCTKCGEAPNDGRLHPREKRCWPCYVLDYRSHDAWRFRLVPPLAPAIRTDRGEAVEDAQRWYDTAQEGRRRMERCEEFYHDNISRPVAVQLALRGIQGSPTWQQAEDAGIAAEQDTHPYALTVGRLDTDVATIRARTDDLPDMVRPAPSSEVIRQVQARSMRDGSRIQNGEAYIQAGNTTQDIAIAAVNRDRAMLHITGYAPQEGQVMGMFLNETMLRFQRQGTVGDCIVGYQVIEFGVGGSIQSLGTIRDGAVDSARIQSIHFGEHGIEAVKMPEKPQEKINEVPKEKVRRRIDLGED